MTARTGVSLRLAQVGAQRSDFVFSKGFVASLVHLRELLSPSPWYRKAGALRLSEQAALCDASRLCFTLEFQPKLSGINDDQCQLSFSFLGFPPKTPTLLDVLLSPEPFRSFRHLSLSLPVPTMKSTFGIFSFIVLAGVAFAHPLPRDDAPSGTWVIIFRKSRQSS